MAKADLTAQRLRELLDYDQETGIFRWRIRVSPRINPGSVAGYSCNKGYWRISIDDRLYFAHRLAWLYMFERWPEKQIDHIDRKTSNNRLSNLREVTQSENEKNKAPRKNKSGSVGIYPSRGRFRAVLILGTFDTKEEATTSYQRARTLLSL